MKNPNFSASTSASPDEKFSEEKKKQTDVAASFKASKKKPFVLTPENYQFLEDLYQSGILPIIVLYRRRRRNRIQSLKALEGVPLCGAVFLKREESRLEQMSDSDLKSVGFQLPKTLDEAIQANWSYYDKHKHIKFPSDDHGSIPCITMNMINENCFEFSAPEAKWIVLGSSNMVDASCNGSMLMSATKYYSLLRVMLSSAFHYPGTEIVCRVRKYGIHIHLLMFLGYLLAMDFAANCFHGSASIIDRIEVTFDGVAIFFLYVGMSRLSSPSAYRLTGAAVVCSLVLSSWTTFHEVPLPYFVLPHPYSFVFIFLTCVIVFIIWHGKCFCSSAAEANRGSKRCWWAQ